METWKFPWCHSTCRRAEQQSAAGTALLLATCSSPLLYVCVGVDCKSRTFCIGVGEICARKLPRCTVVTSLRQYNVHTRLQARSWSPGSSVGALPAAAAPWPVHDSTNKTGISSDSTDILDDIFSTFNMDIVLGSTLIF